MKTILILLTMSAAALAADPAGVHYWSAAELKEFDGKLSPKVDAQKFAGQSFGALGKNATAMIAHREGAGVAEVHKTQNDIFFVQSGQATLVLGGEAENAKETQPNEVRGTAIKGGSQRKISAGDVIFIPAKVPHQLLMDQGKHFTYFVVKVNE